MLFARKSLITIFLILNILNFYSAHVFALSNKTYKIPYYQLPLGMSLTSVNDTHTALSLIKESGEQHFEGKRNNWLRLLSRFSEDKRKYAKDEYLLWVINQSETDDTFSHKPKKGSLSGLQIRFYHDEDKLMLEPLDDSKDSFDSEQKKQLRWIAEGNTYYDDIIKLISDRNLTEGSEINLDEKALKAFNGESGELVLTRVQLMWEKEIAHFQLNVKGKLFSNKILSSQCLYNFWVLVETGQPVNFSSRCNNHFTTEQGLATVIKTIRRGYSYLNQNLSTISPVLLPSLQPRGIISDLAFSEKLEQLIFLTHDYSNTSNFLTFWDINQRKMLNTLPVTGETLHLSDEGNIIQVSSETRIHNAFTHIMDKYKPFGNASNFDTIRTIIDSNVFGVYPVTLNEKNEIEVWNTGYGNIILRKELLEPEQLVLAIAQDGRLITASKHGTLHFFKLKILNPCGNNSIQQGWCDKAQASLDSLDKTINLNPVSTNKEISNKITNLEIHPRQPLAGICFESSATQYCQIINTDTEKVVSIPASILHFSNSDEVIYTNKGLYNFEGQKITGYPSLKSKTKHQAISEPRQITFVENYDFQNIGNELIQMRDLKNGKLIDEIKAESNEINGVHIFNDSSILFLANKLSENKVFLFDLANMKMQSIPSPAEIQGVEINEHWMALNYKNSGMLFAVSKTDSTKIHSIKTRANDFKLLDQGILYANGKYIDELNFKTGETTRVYEFKSEVQEFEILSPEGNKIIARLQNGLFSWPHINKELTLAYHDNFPNSILVDQQRQSIFITGLRDNSGNFNPQIPLIARYNFSGDKSYYLQASWFNISSIVNTSNGELWTGSTNGRLLIRDQESGLIIENIQAHTGHITGLAQLDKNTIVSTSNDGTIKFWHLNRIDSDLTNHFPAVVQSFFANDIANRQLKLIATLVTNKQGDHIIQTNDGYYAATPKALHRASFMNNKTIFDYTRYDFWLNRPDRVAKRLNKTLNESIMLLQKMVEFRQARQPDLPRLLPQRLDAPKLVVSGPQTIMLKDNAHFSWEVKDNNATQLHVLVNQVPLYGIQGKAISNKTGDIEIPLSNGLNKIQIYVTDHTGLASKSQFFALNKPFDENKKPDLYVLSIGVSNYSNDKIDLEYAQKDALDISQALQKSIHFQTVKSKVIADEQVNRQSISAAREFLLSAKPDDRVIVFFAGHGFLDKNNNYFFGTHDVDPNHPEINGLAYPEIVKLIDNIPSRYKLLMLDTCHSGEVSVLSNPANLAANVKARGIKVVQSTPKSADFNLSVEMLQNTFVDLRASTGAIIIGASGGLEYALENDQYKNGVFTASVLRGLLEKAADSDKNGKVSVSELREFTYSEVSRLTGGEQKPSTRKYNLDTDFNIF